MAVFILGCERRAVVFCITPSYERSVFVWIKKGNGFTATVGPFVANVVPKGDGRWTWEVFADNSAGAQASGVGSNAGAAKTAAEQLIKRSGRV